MISACLASDLPAPERIQLKSDNFKTIESDNNQVKKQIKKICENIKVTYHPGVEKRNINNYIYECVSFLLKEYGNPFYQNKINLIITDDQNNYGKIVWTDRNINNRNILLNELNLYPDKLYILVHEMFHALYETNEFFKNNPEVITEGLAVYAEYKYRYQNWNDIKMLNYLKRQCKSINPNYQEVLFDFDKPFNIYQNSSRDLLYIMSGMIFFSQNYKDPKDEVRTILEKGQKVDGRKSFKWLVKFYNIKDTENLFHVITEPESYPKPKKLSGGK